MEEVQTRDFNIANYEHLFMEFDLNNYRVKPGEINLALTPNQNQLFKYAEVDIFNIKKNKTF